MSLKAWWAKRQQKHEHQWMYFADNDVDFDKKLIVTQAFAKCLTCGEWVRFQKNIYDMTPEVEFQMVQGLHELAMHPELKTQ